VPRRCAPTWPPNTRCRSAWPARSALRRALRRDQARLFCWDGLSLALCLGWAPYTTPEVDGRTLVLEAAGDGVHTLSPWPFDPPELVVRCEGRLLREQATSEVGLHDALERAERVDLRFTLTPPAP
jgi:hypothetical protein